MFYFISTLWGAVCSLIFGRIARYAPSHPTTNCIPIKHF